MDNTLILPFNEDKQAALLGHILNDKKFFKNVYTKIKPAWFISEKHSKIYKLLLSYYNTYGIFPSIPEFKAYREFGALEFKERELLFAHLSSCIAGMSQYRIEPLIVDLTDWLHSVILLDALKGAETDFNRQNIKECHSKLMKAVQDVNNSKFNNEEAVDFLAFRDYLSQAENERRNALTTGLALLDNVLLDGADGGGLLYGDTSLIIGGTNAGKSTHMITIAAHNIKRNKDVLYMTHEDKKESIRLKIISCYMGLTIPDLLVLVKTPEGADRIKEAVTHIHQHLKYIPYNKAGKMTVENVVPIIRQNQDDWVMEHEGKGFDLLVSDYPFVLTTELAYKGSLQRRNIDDIICNNYVQLALEYNFHALLAAQTNRTGFTVNRGGAVKRLLNLDDIREGFGPATQVGNCWTLNRSPDDERRNVMTLNLVKCRSNAKNIAVCVKTDFSHNKTHSNELGGFTYAGIKTPEENVEELLRQFNGLRIPDTQVALLGL